MRGALNGEPDAAVDTSPLRKGLPERLPVSGRRSLHDGRVWLAPSLARRHIKVRVTGKVGNHDDIALLEAVSRGEWATAGFRNRDLRRLLHPSKRLATVEEARKLSARISRRLRLLRAHGIINKIQKSHRYRITEKGQQLTAALFAAREATVEKLIGKAAA